LAGEMIGKGIIAESVAIFNDGGRRGKINFGNIGKGLSRFPFVLSLPQDVHERIVICYLQRKNIEVEWNRELIYYEETEGGIKAVISDGDGQERLKAGSLCGCDGPGRSVRKQMRYDVPGGI